jgi:predicted DNA-binding transcriptional regulator AlpA
MEGVMKMSNDKLLTPKEVKTRLNVSKSTLYGWHQTKTYLQPKKVGGALRYRESDVEKFIDGEGDAHGEGNQK